MEAGKPLAEAGGLETDDGDAQVEAADGGQRLIHRRGRKRDAAATLAEKG